MPKTMKTMQVMRMILIGSLNKTIPKTTVPTVPMPVQIAYAFPSGKLFKDTDKTYTLAAIPISVSMLGHILVKPCEYFNPAAQPTSREPAITR